MSDILLVNAKLVKLKTAMFPNNTVYPRINDLECGFIDTNYSCLDFYLGIACSLEPTCSILFILLYFLFIESVYSII